MIINRVTMQNFCQHKDRKEDLGPGMIGIVGKNGNGKSNLVRSMLFGLSGDSGGAGTKADDITNGEKGGHVRVDFTVGDESGFIKRDLKTSRTQLKFGEEDHRSAREADKVIYNLMQISPKLLREVVFVGQGRIESMLFEKPAERGKAFAALFGTDRMERIRDLLQQDLTKVQAVSNAEAIELARNEKQSLEKQLADHQSTLTLLGHKTLTLEEVRRAEGLIDVYKERNRAQATLNEAEQQLAGLKRTREELQKTSAAKAEKRRKGGEVLQELQGEYDAAKARIQNADKLQSVQERRVFLQHEIDRCVKRLEAPLPKKWSEEDEEKLKQHKADIDRLNEPVANARKVVASLDQGAATCPTCTQPVPPDFVEQQMAVLQHDGNLLQNAEQLHAALNDRRIEQDQAVMADTSERTEAKIKLDAARGELAQLGEASEPASSETDKAVVAEYEALRKETSGHELELATTMGQLKQLDDNIRNAGQNVEAMRKALWQMDEVSQQAAMDADTRLKDHYDAQLSVSDVQGQTKTLEERLQSTSERLERMEGDEAKIAKRLEWRKLCEEARMVLHRNHLPNRVAQAYLGSINAKMNEYLEVFQARYTCAIRPDLSVKCHFGEYELPAERLSGGQRVELGLSFRFALYDLFVGHLGLLVIDEPTAWLDDDHIEAVARVLERVKAHSKSKGMQVIVVTHEPRLIPIFDNFIQV